MSFDKPIRIPKRLWLVLARDNRMVDRAHTSKRSAQNAANLMGDHVVGPYVLAAQAPGSAPKGDGA